MRVTISFKSWRKRFRITISFWTLQGGETLPPLACLRCKTTKKMETEQNVEKKNRGGKREGAGRKKIRGCTVGFRTTLETEAILKTIERRTDFINEAIVWYYNSRNGGKWPPIFILQTVCSEVPIHAGLTCIPGTPWRHQEGCHATTPKIPLLGFSCLSCHTVR